MNFLAQNSEEKHKKSPLLILSDQGGWFPENPYKQGFSLARPNGFEPVASRLGVGRSRLRISAAR